MSPLEALAWIGVATVAIFIALLGYSMFTGIKDKREIARRDAGLDNPQSIPAPVNKYLCDACRRAPSARHRCADPEMCACTGDHTV